MVDVVWLDQATSVVRAIYYWYVQNMGKNAADKFKDNFLSKAQLLSSNPRLGKLDSQVRNDELEVRVLYVKRKHRLIYYLQDEVVYIMYVQSCRQMNIFF